MRVQEACITPHVDLGSWAGCVRACVRFRRVCAHAFRRCIVVYCSWSMGGARACARHPFIPHLPQNAYARMFAPSLPPLLPPSLTGPAHVCTHRDHPHARAAQSPQPATNLVQMRKTELRTDGICAGALGLSGPRPRDTVGKGAFSIAGEAPEGFGQLFRYLLTSIWDAFFIRHCQHASAK